MNNIIAEITKALATIEGNKFVSLTYLSIGSGELARHTLNVGFNYHTLVEKDVTELELLIAERSATWDENYRIAAAKIMESRKKTLAAHAAGTQNDDYTKKGQYIPIGAGVNVNSVDNTIQLFGLSHSKTVLVEGVHKVVKSSPVTIARRNIEKLLPSGRFREFAIDPSQVAQVKVNGETLELISV